jgi:phage baseplate assembly protein W
MAEELKGFTGISFPFRFSPSGGVTVSTTSPSNFAHIRESIEQIILTEVGERVMEDFGAKLKNRIFDPIDDLSDESAVLHSIRRAIERHEKRVEIEDINMSIEDATLIISVDVFVEKYYATDTFNYRVERGDFN